MGKYIEKVKIAVLFLLLAAVAISPSLLIAYQNKEHLEKVNTESYTAKLEVYDEFESSDSDAENYSENLTEKLLALVEITEGTQIVEQIETIDLQWEKELLNTLSSELIKLQELNAIPQFDLQGSGNIYDIRTLKILNTVQKNEWIELRDISVEYDNVSIGIVMDVETSLIFNIHVRSNSNSLSLKNVPFQNFAQYLGYENSYVLFEANQDSIDEIDTIYGTYQILYNDLLISFYVSGNQEHFQYTLLDAAKFSK